MGLTGTHHELIGNAQIFYLKPIAYSQNGSLKRITNVYENTGDPDLTQGVDELIQFRFAPQLGVSPAFHFGTGTSFVDITPLGVNSVSGEVGRAGGGGVSGNGNRFLYRGAWNGADLEFLTGGHIVRKLIHLQAGHPDQFQFRIDDHNLDDPGNLSGKELRFLHPYLYNPNSEDDPIGLVWNVKVQGGAQYRALDGAITLTITLPPGDYTGWTLDPTITLQPDPTEGKDTYITTNSEDANYGTYYELWMGYSGFHKALLQFDLSSIPSSEPIVSATLSVYVTYLAGTAQRAAYRGLVEWWEGSRGGTDPPAGEDGSTWNERNNNGSVAWLGGAGGGGGSDYATPATDNTDVSESAWADFDITADVADWVAGEATNYGTWLFGGNSRADIHSSDSGTASRRPKLTVLYGGPLRSKTHLGVSL